MTHQNLNRRIVMLGSLAISMSLAACSKPTTIKSVWQEQADSPVVAAAPYNGIIVIGITNNSNQRRRFENEMTGRLKQAGTTAWPSHTALEPGAEINRETILAAANKLSASAVLVSRLANNQVATKQVDERTEVESTPQSQTPIGIFRKDYNEYEEPGYVVVTHTVRLDTDFYAVKDSILLYSMKSTTYDKETEFDVLDDVTDAIAKRLSRDGLIK